MSYGDAVRLIVEEVNNFKAIRNSYPVITLCSFELFSKLFSNPSEAVFVAGTEIIPTIYLSGQSCVATSFIPNRKGYNPL